MKSSEDLGSRNNKCQVFISNYIQTSAWYSSGNSIKIESESACASRLGRPFELIDTKMTIFKNGKIFATFYSPIGFYSPNQNRILLGRISAVSGKGRISNVKSLVLDAQTGILRAPHGLYLQLAKINSL